MAIDITAALALPGVVAILTGDDLARAGVKPLPQSADFKRADGSPTAAPPQHALALGTVRFVGEAVAAVLAETPLQARDAVEAIEVGYEPLPMVADLGDALAPGAPLVWPEATGNVAVELRHGDAAASAAAFAQAAHGVRARSHQPACDSLPDRTACDAGQLRPGDRTYYAARVLPDADGRARRLVR